MLPFSAYFALGFASTPPASPFLLWQVINEASRTADCERANSYFSDGTEEERAQGRYCGLQQLGDCTARPSTRFRFVRQPRR